MSLYTLPCVLFAGGKSSRMGKDKAYLPFADADTLLQYQYERLKKLFISVYISTKDASRVKGFDAAIIEDLLAKDLYAPTAGFINIFATLKSEEALFVLSVDTPFVTDKIIHKVLSTPFDAYDAVIVRTPGGIHPLCGVYSRTLEKDIIEMVEADDHRLGKLLSRSNVCYIDIEEEDALMNINTPQEYEKALKRLQTTST